ncbi:glycosyltransferase family 2 protein [Natrinema sp. H-ect4]|uniref:glycosyltransferase n=1 Tax=Natrinema sp. H-ect4 TaxID=3242699 RepID=UPI0035A8BFE8
MRTVDASVVVPARDEGARIERTLDSLAAQRFNGSLEVITVASGAETLRVARAHPAVDRVLADDRREGPGAARNRGVAGASGDVLLFTDADTVVPPSWVRRHYRHYATPEVVGVGGPLRPLENGLRHRACFRVLSDWWYRACWPVGFVQQPGCNCSVRRTTFEAIGGFDDSLGYLEDTDLSLRLRREGTVAYDHTCPVDTSTRRQERVGYGRLCWTYLVGYLEYALPGLSPTREYF